jgi:ketosteroid isomerase-like protein
MKEQKAITGQEKRIGRQTPFEALVEFYHAFNTRNIALMEQNWDSGDEIAMDNPLGGIMLGWENVRALYQRIFEGKAKVYVEFYDYSLHETDQMFYAVGRERGFFETGGQKLELAIHTSRIFKKVAGTWRQVHHHGSIEDPLLLKSYQEFVTK